MRNSHLFGNEKWTYLGKFKQHFRGCLPASSLKPMGTTSGSITYQPELFLPNSPLSFQREFCWVPTSSSLPLCSLITLVGVILSFWELSLQSLCSAKVLTKLLCRMLRNVHYPSMLFIIIITCFSCIWGAEELWREKKELLVLNPQGINTNPNLWVSLVFTQL